MLLGFWVSEATYQVTVHDTRGVHVLETAHDLVEEVLHKLLLERAARQQTVQVGAEQLGDEVQIFEGRDENVAQADDLVVSTGRTYILVPDILEQLQLTVCAFRQHGGGEGLHDLLDSHRGVRQLVPGTAHQAECAHTDGLQILIA